MRKRHLVIYTALLTLSIGLIEGCKTQNLRVTNAALDAANACQKIYGGDPMSMACKEANKRLAQAKASKVDADEYDSKIDADRAAYVAKYKDSEEKTEFAGELALRQSAQNASLTKQFPHLKWLTETWCETTPSLGETETQSYRVLEQGGIRRATYIEKKIPTPQRPPYTLVHDFSQVRVLNDTDLELWLFYPKESTGTKSIVHLRKKSSKQLMVVSYKVFEFPKNSFREDFSLTGGTQTHNSSRVKEYKTCKWNPI